MGQIVTHVSTAARPRRRQATTWHYYLAGKVKQGVPGSLVGVDRVDRSFSDDPQSREDTR